MHNTKIKLSNTNVLLIGEERQAVELNDVELNFVEWSGVELRTASKQNSIVAWAGM